MVRVDNHIQIYGWMISGLNLSGNELLCFAIIFSFCQDGKSKMISSKYFSSWLGVKKRWICYILARLRDKGLINIEYKPGKTSFYSINVIELDKRIQNATKREEENPKNVDKLPIAEDNSNKNILRNRTFEIIQDTRKEFHKERKLTPEEEKQQREIRDVILNTDWTIHD